MIKSVYYNNEVMCMKKMFVLASGLFGLYFALFLACASAPEEVEEASLVTAASLNAWLKGYEEKIQVENDLTPKQLMEVTKLCMKSGELKDVSIIEENEVLAFAVLEDKITINKTVLKYQFNYSISKAGVLTLKIKEITEDVEGNFKVSVYNSKLEGYKESVIAAFSEKLKKNAEVVINRSKDFA